MRLTSILVLPVLFALQPNGSIVSALPLGDPSLNEIRASDYACFNTGPGQSKCQECKSNGNGNYVKCITEPPGVKVLSRYVNAQTHDGPNTILEDEQCPGIARTYPDADCEQEVLDTDTCGRTWSQAKYNGTTERECPAPTEGPPKGL